MILNLKKNEVFDLTNEELNKIKVGVGWDISSTDTNFDLDLSVALIREGMRFNKENDLVYYLSTDNSAIELSEDNREGDLSEDDEYVSISLNEIDSDIKELVFIVTIYQALTKKQSFDMVDNLYIRLIHNNEELCRFELEDEGNCATGMLFAKIYKDESRWKFKAIGEGRVSNLTEIINLF